MNEHPDFKPGFNLILCYYAIRDAERMRKSFLKLLNVNSNVDDEKYNVIRFAQIKHTDSSDIYLLVAKIKLSNHYVK